MLTLININGLVGNMRQLELLSLLITPLESLNPLELFFVLNYCIILKISLIRSKKTFFESFARASSIKRNWLRV